MVCQRVLKNRKPLAPTGPQDSPRRLLGSAGCTTRIVELVEFETVAQVLDRCSQAQPSPRPCGSAARISRQGGRKPPATTIRSRLIRASSSSAASSHCM